MAIIYSSRVVRISSMFKTGMVSDLIQTCNIDYYWTNTDRLGIQVELHRKKAEEWFNNIKEQTNESIQLR